MKRAALLALAALSFAAPMSAKAQTDPANMTAYQFAEFCMKDANIPRCRSYLLEVQDWMFAHPDRIWTSEATCEERRSHNVECTSVKNAAHVSVQNLYLYFIRAANRLPISKTGDFPAKIASARDVIIYGYQMYIIGDLGYRVAPGSPNFPSPIY